MGNIIKGLITSPDYKFKDFKAIMVNGYMNNISLWKEILQIDLSIALSNVDIPYIMIQGSTDIVASTKTVRELVHNQSSTNLSYVIIDNAGHYPSAEGMDSVLKQLTALTK